MAGLGPLGTSLKERLGRPPGLTWPDPFSLQLEQQDRGEARKEKAMWHAMKNRTPKKPLAPVEPSKKLKGLPRRWKWVGEPIESKGLLPGLEYDTEVIREAGFKLPALPKKPKKLEGEIL